MSNITHILQYTHAHLPHKAISMYTAAPSRGSTRSICIIYLQLTKYAKRSEVVLQKYMFMLAFIRWFLETKGRCGT